MSLSSILKLLFGGIFVNYPGLTFQSTYLYTSGRITQLRRNERGPQELQYHVLFMHSGITL